MPTVVPVTRSSLPEVLPIAVPMPMPLLPSPLWTTEEWARIQLGHRSRGMDEKWDVFAEDRVVFLHRSWTGRGTFEATFAPVGDSAWRIAEAVVESDPDRYRRSTDEFDCLLLELVLRAIVLNQSAAKLRAKFVALAVQQSGRADLVAGVILHSALGLRSETMDE